MKCKFVMAIKYCIMVKIEKHSGIYTLTEELVLPIRLDKAWDFFSSPLNLQKITPEEMGFKITSGNVKKMHPGQIITYKVGVAPMIKSSWVTEITHVDEKKYFVDEQRFGPYKMWHHEHHFEEVKEGVKMIDKVSYKLPLGFLGQIAHAIFVKRQLTKIFSHRTEVLTKLFPN